MYRGFKFLIIRICILLFHKPMCVFCVHIRIFVRLCSDFAHNLRLLRTYTAYILRKVCNFCVRVRLLARNERFLICWKSQCSDLEGYLISWKPWWYHLEGSWIFWPFPCKRSWCLDRLEDPIFRVLLSYLSDDLHVMIGPSRGSDLQGSVEFFIWQSACDSPSDLTLDTFLQFLVDFDRSIYVSRWSNNTVLYAALW